MLRSIKLPSFKTVQKGPDEVRPAESGAGPEATWKHAGPLKRGGPSKTSTLRVWFLGLGLAVLVEACAGGMVKTLSARVAQTQPQDEAARRSPVTRRAKTASAARTVTSTRSGNWSAAATWGGLAPPGRGDIAVINHNVLITANTAIGDGSSSTVLDVTNGALAVWGATLTIRGNAVFGKYNSGKLVVRLRVSSTTTTSGGIELDGNAGVAPVVSLNNDTGIHVMGTARDRCFLRTRSGTPGRPGRFTNGGSSKCFYAIISYCDLARLGDASNPGIRAPYLDGGDKPFFSFDHATFDSCGTIPSANIEDGSIKFALTNSTWTNSVGPFAMSVTASEKAQITTGFRRVDGCFFASGPAFRMPLGFTITNSYFGSPPTAAAESATWASFDGNFVVDNDGGHHEHQFGGDVTNCYFFANPTEEPGVTGFILTAQFANSQISNNVFQYNGKRPDAGAVGITEAGPNSRTITIKNNIVLPTAAPGSMKLSGLTSNSSFAWTEYAVIEHNTILVGNACAINDGVTVGAKPGTVLSLKSNIFYRTGGPPSDQFAFSNQEPAPHTDVVRAANADYNGWFNLGTVPAGKWNGIADGTVYSTPMSGSTPPGVHDKANIDPKFSDPTRNLQTWDAALGGPGTIARRSIGSGRISR